MYLLNSAQIRRYVDEPPGQRLEITRFFVSNLQHTAYYFRLGERYDKAGSGGLYDQTAFLSETDPILELAPFEYVRVRSHEMFRLSSSILGILGGVSDLARAGLHLVCSPFIDPLYPAEMGIAALELGIQNLSNHSTHLEFCQTIGKVAFFDISDTYPVELIAGSPSARKFEERRDTGMA